MQVDFDAKFRHLQFEMHIVILFITQLFIVVATAQSKNKLQDNFDLELINCIL